MTPVEALEAIAFVLERELAPSYRVKAFRNASLVVRGLPPEDLVELSAQNQLTSLNGIGDVTAQVITQALAGEIPDYLVKLQETPAPGVAGQNDIWRALKGDCHTHSLWSDGGSPIGEMARVARSLGHEYIVMTDHSPRLKVANGLTRERLEQQLEEIALVNKAMSAEHELGAPAFRVLTGIEVDILDDGALDQDDDILRELDVVVASVHSHLRAPSTEMTPRMLAAIAHPRTNILGHCTGRKVVGRGRPPSEFDAEAVFAACVEHDVAVEINSRPERKDPPRDLLRMAVAAGCKFAVDTDAHAPGQLAWQSIGTERAEECGVSIESIVNTQNAEGLVSWARTKL